MDLDGTSKTTRADALRGIPSISSVLSDARVRERTEGLREELVTSIARSVVDGQRAAILAGHDSHLENDVVDLVLQSIDALMQPKLHEVINATGVIVHTNLGRSPVSEETARAMVEAAAHYVPLEIELEAGRRGGRMAEVTRLMSLLAGAEATLVVNNNAAAVLADIERALFRSRSHLVAWSGSGDRRRVPRP